MPRTFPSRSPYRAGTPGQWPPLCRLRRLLAQGWLAAAKRPPLPCALSNRRGERTRALRMRTRGGAEGGTRAPAPPARGARLGPVRGPAGRRSAGTTVGGAGETPGQRRQPISAIDPARRLAEPALNLEAG